MNKTVKKRKGKYITLAGAAIIAFALALAFSGLFGLSGAKSKTASADGGLGGVGYNTLWENIFEDNTIGASGTKGKNVVSGSITPNNPDGISLSFRLGSYTKSGSGISFGSATFNLASILLDRQICGYKVTADILIYSQGMGTNKTLLSFDYTLLETDNFAVTGLPCGSVSGIYTNAAYEYSVRILPNNNESVEYRINNRIFGAEHLIESPSSAYAVCVSRVDILIPVYPLPPEPELEHHTFAGWFYDAALTQPYDGLPIYTHTDFYAKFIPLTYYIVFTGALFANYPDIAVTALTAYSGVLPTPSRTGYTFKGWFLDAGLTTEYAPITSMTGNVTLYAGWERIILTVTFYVKGAVYAEIQLPYGTTLAEAVAAAQGDSVIISAMYSDFNLYNALSANTVITGDMAIYAELGAGIEEKTGFFRRVGAWFGDNWAYFPIAAGFALIGAAALFIILKKKEII